MSRWDQPGGSLLQHAYDCRWLHGTITVEFWPKEPSSGSDFMTRTSRAFLEEQIELNDQLLAGRERMFNPQDLPGRYGRVVRAVDHLLQVIQCEAVVGGGLGRLAPRIYRAADTGSGHRSTRSRASMSFCKPLPYPGSPSYRANKADGPSCCTRTRASKSISFPKVPVPVRRRSRHQRRSRLRTPWGRKDRCYATWA